MDLVRLQFFMTFQSVPDEDIVDIVDTVFLPLATGTTRAGDAGGAGARTTPEAPPDPARAWATGRRAGPLRADLESRGKAIPLPECRPDKGRNP
ncbi:hypothetical protein [Propionibacterium freudenreichii]|uniref:hypothetical protein n=1 Tax=Propionibacterium freudenreichii TaxID=1744 RepID=UPI00254AF513|nr:hypothetical protein [Propionibacterium freudenreichii]